MSNLGTNGTCGKMDATTTPAAVTVVCPANTTVSVSNDPSGASVGRVNFDGLHDNADFAYVPVGQVRWFVTPIANPIITFKTDAGTATLYAEIAVLPPGYGNR